MKRVSDKYDGSRFRARVAKWKIDTFVKNMDSFGQEVPSFNIKGEKRVTTLFGGTITALILLLTLAYATFKGIQLVGRTNPTINDYPIPSYFDIS